MYPWPGTLFFGHTNPSSAGTRVPCNAGNRVMFSHEFSGIHGYPDSFQMCDTCTRGRVPFFSGTVTGYLGIPRQNRALFVGCSSGATKVSSCPRHLTRGHPKSPRKRTTTGCICDQKPSIHSKTSIFPFFAIPIWSSDYNSRGPRIVRYPYIRRYSDVRLRI